MHDADADGICDDVDDCVGEYDDCSVFVMVMALLMVSVTVMELH